MRVYRSNTELKRLQDELRNAIEDEDLSLAEKLVTAIEDIRYPSSFVKTGKDQRKDKRTGVTWYHGSSYDRHDWSVVNDWVNNRLINDSMWKYPDSEYFIKLCKDIDYPMSTNLPKLGFFEVYDLYWVGESFKLVDPTYSTLVKVFDFFRGEIIKRPINDVQAHIITVNK